MNWFKCTSFFPPTDTPLLVGWSKAVIVDADGSYVEQPHVYPEFVTYDGANWRSIYDPDDIKDWIPDYWMRAPKPPKKASVSNSQMLRQTR